MHERVDQAAEELLQCASIATQTNLEFCEGVDANVEKLKQLMTKADLIQKLLQAFNECPCPEDEDFNSVDIPADGATGLHKRHSATKTLVDPQVDIPKQIQVINDSSATGMAPQMIKRGEESFGGDENRFPGLGNAAAGLSEAVGVVSKTPSVLKSDGLFFSNNASFRRNESDDKSSRKRKAFMPSSPPSPNGCPPSDEPASAVASGLRKS
jgi:hypothetical protein